MKIFFLVGVMIALLIATRAVLRSRRPREGSAIESTPQAPRNELSERLGYSASCKYLQEVGVLAQGPIPEMPDHRPLHDDEEPLGVCLFRTILEGIHLNNLTLPRTYCARSEISKVSFRASDFSESTLCWNDFLKVDFEGANLASSDLRASHYIDVSFKDADLRNSDLRHSYFENCLFRGASMEQVKLTRTGAAHLGLSDEQLDSIDWQSLEGEEPDGG